jgi:Arc/MetJ-type ribon-helix-helix transcriptional regulator
MTKMLTFRVTETLEKRIRMKASAAELPVSEFLRKAIEKALDEDQGLSPYERVKHLIGSVDSGREDLSANHSQIIKEKLRAEHNR